MLWEPPTHIYAKGMSGQHLVPYGVRHRYVARLTGLGQGGIPTGAILLYTGTWAVSMYMATDPTGSTPNTPDAVVAAVLGQTIPGMQVVGQQTSGGSGTLAWMGAPQSFQVKISLQVTGPGFAQANDAKSIIDGLYYQVVGSMPTSSIYVQSLPGAPPGTPPGTSPGTQPGLPGPAVPPGTTPPPQTGASPCPAGQVLTTNIFGSASCSAPSGQLTSWFEQNAAMIGMVLVAALVLPAVIKKI